MPSRPVSPDSVAPDLVLAVEGLISDARRNEGTTVLGPIAAELGEHYRALAICVLADDAEVDLFFHWLLHSPVLRVHCLETVGSLPTSEPKERAASNAAPLLNAMAARQWKLAARIANLISIDWLEGEEYEEGIGHPIALSVVLCGAHAPLNATRGRSGAPSRRRCCSAGRSSTTDHSFAREMRRS